MQSVYNGHPCAYHGHPSTCAVFVLHSSVSEEMDFKDGVKLYCYLIPPSPEYITIMIRIIFCLKTEIDVNIRHILLKFDIFYFTKSNTIFGGLPLLIRLYLIN